MVKFTKHINDYEYVLSFDLAKYKTGWALIDIPSQRIAECGMIVCEGDDDRIWADYKIKIEEVIAMVAEKYPTEKTLITKEKLPNQAGKFSTISALQALAQAHAVWAIVCASAPIDVYDYDGVPAVSVKAHVRKQTGIEKPTKQDVAAYVAEQYQFNTDFVPLDVTDAIGCADVLLESKWNADIKDEIKGIKKQIKGYKSTKKIEELQQKIQFLTTLLKED